VIQKIIVGRGFRGVLNYVFKESTELAHGEARIVDSNMAGRDPRELAHEFSMFRRLNPARSATIPFTHICSGR